MLIFKGDCAILFRRWFYDRLSGHLREAEGKGLDIVPAADEEDPVRIHDDHDQSGEVNHNGHPGHAVPVVRMSARRAADLGAGPGPGGVILRAF